MQSQRSPAVPRILFQPTDVLDYQVSSPALLPRPVLARCNELFFIMSPTFFFFERKKRGWRRYEPFTRALEESAFFPLKTRLGFRTEIFFRSSLTSREANITRRIILRYQRARVIFIRGERRGIDRRKTGLNARASG